MERVPVVVISAEKYEPQCINQAVSEMFSHLNLPSDTFSGKNVFLKINLVRDMPPERCGTTHPLVTAACARHLAYEMGANSVTVGDSSGGFFTDNFMKTVYRVTQTDKAVEMANAQAVAAGQTPKVFLNSNYQSRRCAFEGGRLHSIEIIDAFTCADTVVNLGKLKTHSFTGFTGCVKNLFGLIPGLVKVDMHSKFSNLMEFCDMLVDIERFAHDKISLNILDAVIGMEGEGPTNGTPRHIGKLLASVCPYAVDIAGVSLFADPRQMPLLITAAERQIIPADILSAADVDYAALQSDFIKDFQTVKVVNTDFIRLPRFMRRVLKSVVSPRVTVRKNRCKACWKCVKHCPGKALAIKKGAAHVTQKKCIRCYCCQELCPHNAIRLSKPLVHRISRSRKKPVKPEPAK